MPPEPPTTPSPDPSDTPDARASWAAYEELAWTDRWLATPDEVRDEAETYLGLLQAAADGPLHTVLHLGCGAGGYDTVFTRAGLEIIGVDLSEGMLELAREANPGVEYHLADMREVRLGRTVDAVVIPDSIDYMVTPDDLRATVTTAVAHLRPGGILLVVATTAETFRPNNFAYTGERDGIHLTLLENDHAPDLARILDSGEAGTYEATLVFLVRRDGELEVHVDRHLLGLFPAASWQEVFTEAGLEVATSSLVDGLYDRWTLDGTEHPLTVFIARVPGDR